MIKEKIFKVLEGPHISEKASLLADREKQIVFKVSRRATKQDIKEAVEQMFSVQVKKVNVLNVPGKRKKTKGHLGKRNDWKKAYVALQPGCDINFSEFS